MKKIIGIYGGSFNPIHYGHIGVAKWVKEHTTLDEVWLMVSPNNPLKDSKILAPEQERFGAVKEAIKDIPGLVASDFEFNLPRPSYMAKTLKELKKTYPAYDFVLIIGADNISTFNKWKDYEYILKNYKILVYPRKCEEDYSVLVSPDSEENWVDICGYDELYLWDAPWFNISSTEIRNRNKNN